MRIGVWEAEVRGRKVRVVSPAGYIAILLPEPDGIRPKDAARTEAVAERCGIPVWDVAEEVGALHFTGVLDKASMT